MVRVRFAPSPTGPLHIGGVRTALYNSFFARKNGGSFILRIEDTDQTRFVPGAEAYIIESLTWCGIRFDEGPHCGGPFGPYRQSDRKEIYKQYALELIDRGHAYYAFDTAEELDVLRKSYESEKKTFQYDAQTRQNLRNSLTLGPEETSKLLHEGVPYTIRLLVPEHTEVSFDDLIRGHVVVKSENIDDKVLFKSDGMPTYHLANIVDDHLMEITHVIRGEEWLPSAPHHVLLYQAFGWERPQFAHLPLLLKPDGNGKLSKRDGDRLGFPVFPMQFTDPNTGEKSSGYRESGYFPEAFVNMLALLGWNPGDEREIMSMEEMSELFSLERVSKGGAKFDPVKARWFNHQYLQKKPLEFVADEMMRIASNLGYPLPEKEVMIRLAGMLRERADFVAEMVESCAYFFVAPESWNEADLKKHATEHSAQWLTELAKVFENTDWTTGAIDISIGDFVKSQALPAGKVYNILRISLVGGSSGPHLADILNVLGRSESLNRMTKLAQHLHSTQK